MVVKERSELRWGVEQRLEFIEFRLFWEGRVNRSDLIAQFRISVNQASTDLNRYINLVPGNMVYDKSARSYVRGPRFKPHFRELDARRYLVQLASIADEVANREDSWISELPPYASPPLSARSVDPVTLRSVVEAIRRAEAIQVKYQSLSNRDPRWRWIAPHAIAFDGFFWHARAFCMTNKSFRDFLLSRIIEIRGTRESSVSPDKDTDWNNDVILEIGPHPELSEAHAKAIALDYGMRDGKVIIRVRRALVCHALTRLGIGRIPGERKAKNQQLVLLNSEAVHEDRG